MNNKKEVLKKYWGFDDFRWNQEQAIDVLLNWNDLIYVAKTWDWKSICYQIPALVNSSWVTIIVSPLISLMQDQVRNLKKKKVHWVECLNSAMDPKEKKDILRSLYCWELSMLYISPERLVNWDFIESLKDLEINYLIIDEFDSINEYWKSGFRQDYLKLWSARARLEKATWKEIPVAAFTATATPKMQSEAIESLNMKEEETEVIIWEIVWNNISMNIEQFRAKWEKDDYLYWELKRAKKLIKKKWWSAIIFCTSKKDVEYIYAWLKKKKFDIAKYHGWMSDSRRNSAFNNFVKWKVDYIVCTNAFWRWVDKSNIRFVFHYWTPWSITAYLQEVWRAWRDWEESEAILIYNWKDIVTRNFIIWFDNDKKLEFKKFQDFLDNKNDCRLWIIRNHFWDKTEHNKCWKCDNCINN